jgi:hypothetical protein
MHKVHTFVQGCTSFTELARDAQASYIWPGMNKLYSVGKGCFIDLARDAQASYSWSGLHKLHTFGQGCTSFIQIARDVS